MPGNATIRGHLEKKKDWIRRTRDHQEKRIKIRHLKRSARERNPDEFHFHMLRSQVGLDGLHRDMDSDDDDETQTETQRLLNDVGDIQYARYKLGIEQKRIEKLTATLHFCVESNPTSKPLNKHIIFADDDEQARSFDPFKHFNTCGKFLTRTFNRIVEGHGLTGNVEANQTLKEGEKERRRLYAELGKRMEREQELRVVLQKLELKKDLALSKKSELKPKLIQKGEERKAAVYKWTYERKK